MLSQALEIYGFHHKVSLMVGFGGVNKGEREK